jgi:hypothetical protein
MVKEWILFTELAAHANINNINTIPDRRLQVASLTMTDLIESGSC